MNRQLFNIYAKKSPQSRANQSDIVIEDDVTFKRILVNEQFDQLGYQNQRKQCRSNISVDYNLEKTEKIEVQLDQTPEKLENDEIMAIESTKPDINQKVESEYLEGTKGLQIGEVNYVDELLVSNNRNSKQYTLWKEKKQRK